MQASSWFVWSAVLFLQNFAFTYVSRARSSGSLLRHMKASFFSNGIWIFSQMIMLGPMLDYLTGKHGLGPQIHVGLQYTFTTMAGSIAAHYWALKTEKGKNAVGANKRYAQIPVEEYAEIKGLLAEYREVKAEQAKIPQDAQRDADDVKIPEAPFGDNLSAGTFKIVGPGATLSLFQSEEAANDYLGKMRFNPENYKVVPA